MDESINQENSQTSSENINPESVPSPWKTVKILFKYFILYMIAIIIMIIVMRTLHFPKDVLYPLNDIFMIILLLLMIRGLFRSGFNIEKTFRLYSINKNCIGILLFIGIGASIFGGQIDSFLRLLINYLLDISIKSYGIYVSRYIWVWPYLIIFVVFIAPIIEELLSRGLILSSIESKYGYKKAIIYSSLLFGALHFHASASFAIAIDFILVGYIVYKTNSIISGIIIHGTNNLMSLALKPFYNDTDIGYFPHLSLFFRIGLEIIIFAISIFIIALGIKWINKKLDLSSQHPLTFISDYFRRKNEANKVLPIPSETANQ
jgi:uncharacterized protein